MAVPVSMSVGQMRMFRSVCRKVGPMEAIGIELSVGWKKTRNSNSVPMCFVYEVKDSTTGDVHTMLRVWHRRPKEA